MKKTILVITTLIISGCTASNSPVVPTQPFGSLSTSELASDPTPEAIDFSAYSKSPAGDEPTEEELIQPLFDQALDFCQASQEFWQNGEIENAVQSLDQAYSLIINIESLDNPKLLQQKEDLRFMISKRLLEIYASRNLAVSGSHDAIPVIINKQVKAEIKLFTTRERSFFLQSLKRSGQYRPMILKALKEAGLPAELSWLPLVESGFKVRALSPARALGLWQFIPSTGYMFGLNRNLYIDERLDPYKATHAAIAYMKKMHRLFGDWSTVLAAYNCGQGRVLRIIRTQNINYLDDFWDLYNRLPRETARYVPRFLATLHIVNNLEKYGFENITVDPPLEFETVEVNKQAYLRDIAKVIGTTERTLRNLNPELRYNILPNKKYKLRVPVSKSEELLASIDKVKTSPPPQKAFVYHRVKFGETLSTIARKYRTSMRTIARANNISKRNFIVAGKILKIPQRGAYVASSGSSRKNNYRHATKHIVKRGDSLWIIARKYGTTAKKIKDLNNLKSTNLSIGQVLRLPVRKSATNFNRKNASTYKVKHGDSPFAIAMRHNMELKRLLNINQLKPGSKIYPGQKLYIDKL